jgi:predicted Rossmann fold flavoprotein
MWGLGMVWGDPPEPFLFSADRRLGHFLLGLFPAPRIHSLQMQNWDAIIVGGGGAGLLAAATAGRRGKRVLVLDHGEKLGRKILISGGGRCNFTNLGASSQNYLSANEHFCKSAMARFTPQDFLRLVEKHGISYYEKKLGQLFCVTNAQEIVDLLESECREAGVEIRLRSKVESVEKTPEGFSVKVDNNYLVAKAVVIATGGLSIPKIGATDFGYRVAEIFGLEVTPLAAALVSLTMPDSFLGRFGGLSGVSLDSQVQVNGKVFRENILFTHTGLSGPAILQASLHWYPGDSIEINLWPKENLAEVFLREKKQRPQKSLPQIMSELFTQRLGEKLCEEFFLKEKPLQEYADAQLREVARKIHHWELFPKSDGGYQKAEVTRGGVSTTELHSKTLAAKKVPGLYFIGEVVDVTGWLGGYNFQWAWASGVAAGESL